MDSLYHEVLLELSRNPLNKTVPDVFDIERTEHNPLCGEELTLYVKWGDTDTISLIGWKSDGCVISQTATSLITEAVKGKTKQEIMVMTLNDVTNLLGLANLNPTRQRCASLALTALKKMISL